MKSNPAGWLLGLLCGAVDARDPFVPAVSASCLREVPAPSQWRLQGIIGREADYHGWLLSPQGETLVVANRGQFPLYPWQIGDIQRLSIQLQAAQSCQPRQFSLQLTGRLYEMDAHRATAAQPNRARQ
ncbi:HofP DNA utilization family protein [Pantoea sp. B65]|uniref:HofP DNA utilization family protein n=1 Tax=Pantoea sp. B65 TaxID=2813359 RepID=UPI0039B47A6C